MTPLFYLSVQNHSVYVYGAIYFFLVGVIMWPVRCSEFRETF